MTRKMLGFDLVSDGGLKDRLTDGVPPAKPQAPLDGAAWLRAYGARLAKEGGRLEAPRRLPEAAEVKLRLPGSGRTQVVGSERLMDGRTVSGLNRTKARLEAAGLTEREALDIALNRLAAYRRSPQARWEYQHKKAQERSGE